jgi:hypothetical protein
MLSFDAAIKPHVLWHDCDTSRFDGTQAGALKETKQVSTNDFLEGHDSWGPETKISHEVLHNFSDNLVDGKLVDEELSGLLAMMGITGRNINRVVTVGLIDTPCSRAELQTALYWVMILNKNLQTLTNCHLRQNFY